ncbi:AAA family ATPase [Kitasatospora sp. NPDC049258]|uniref:nucleotide-binding protein n=1 Tax=Kitasatospora sp. NPDC049258 TaxID=3155394 RepID=UPI00343C6F6E
MEPANHFTVLRRYWRLLAGCTAAALLVGFLLTPAGDAVDTAKWQCKAAITPVAGSGDVVKADQVLSYAQGSEVANAAAKKLNLPMASVTGRRTVTAAGTQMLVFATTGPTQQSCMDLAGALANATVDGYSAETQKSADEQIKRAQEQLKTQQAQIDDLQRAASKASGADQARLKPQLDAATNELTETLKRITTLRSTSQTDAIQQWGSIDAKETGGSLLSSPSRGLRLTLAVVLGLALGVVAALMLSRMDTRLRGRNSTEEAFNLPVIGEIPLLSRRLRRTREPLVVARPSDPGAEAYRSLRSTLLLTGPASLSAQFGEGGISQAERVSRRLAEPSPVILVMSGRSGDGRTTTVANLAAALAETGREVLVLDCDFRSPQAHVHFGISDGPGMAELLSGEQLPNLDDLIRRTNVDGVRLITGGNTNAYPAALVLRAGEVLRRARRHADVVLIDSSPLLHANDAYDLVQHADAVLVTVMAGNVKPEQADRVSELLSRTGVPVAGVALLGTDGPSGRRAREAVRVVTTVGGRAGGPAAAAATAAPAAAQPAAGARAAEDPDPPTGPSWARRRAAETPAETTMQLRLNEDL